MSWQILGGGRGKKNHSTDWNGRMLQDDQQESTVFLWLLYSALVSVMLLYKTSYVLEILV